MHVRLQGAGFVERSDAHEPDIGLAPIVAPERGLTLGAAVDVVRTVLARHRHGYRLAAEQLDRPSFDDCVEYERAARQPLAVLAMTAVDEHWLVEELVADGSAGAAARDFLCHGDRASFFFHVSGSLTRPIRHRLSDPAKTEKFHEIVWLSDSVCLTHPRNLWS